MELPRCGTLSEMLATQAGSHPDREAFRFVRGGDVGAAEPVSYGELDRRARRIASLLARRVPGEQSVLLFLAPGPDLVAALFGCLYAGRSAVPLPILPGRVLPHIQREVLSIVRGSGSRAALCDTAGREFAAALHLPPADAGGPLFVHVNEDPGEPRGRAPESVAPGSVAVLQFTSGSTSAPKGVMVTHRSSLHNLHAVAVKCELGPESRSVIWLPHYHDMGLFAGILLPIYAGFPVALMSPVDFVQSPMTWLTALTEHRATTTWAPNFAYDLCVVRRTADARIDLRALGHAVVAAEPIWPRTLERFAETFGPDGFRFEAFDPCYGLAENSLMATGCKVGAGPLFLEVDPERAPPGIVAPADRRIVGCGAPILGTTVRIVDPDTRAPLPEGEVGEIWLRGTSVTDGYFRDPDSDEVFRAKLADGSDEHLRTGDLGFLKGGQLFVVGRIKETIIRNGVKYFPQDIEIVAESRPSVRAGRCYAFTDPSPGRPDAVVLVAEVASAGEPAADLEAELRAVVDDVWTQCNLQIDEAMFVPQGTLLKTSSGKRMRVRCRELHREGALRPIASYRSEAARRRQAQPAARPLDAAELRQFVVERAAALMGVVPASLDGDVPLREYGLDSARAMSLAAEIAARLSRRVDPMIVWDHPTIDRLVAHLAAAGDR